MHTTTVDGQTFSYNRRSRVDLRGSPLVVPRAKNVDEQIRSMHILTRRQQDVLCSWNYFGAFSGLCDHYPQTKWDDLYHYFSLAVSCLVACSEGLALDVELNFTDDQEIGGVRLSAERMTNGELEIEDIHEPARVFALIAERLRAHRRVLFLYGMAGIVNPAHCNFVCIEEGIVNGRTQCRMWVIEPWSNGQLDPKRHSLVARLMHFQVIDADCVIEYFYSGVQKNAFSSWSLSCRSVWNRGWCRFFSSIMYLQLTVGGYGDVYSVLEYLSAISSERRTLLFVEILTHLVEMTLAVRKRVYPPNQVTPREHGLFRQKITRDVSELERIQVGVRQVQRSGITFSTPLARRPLPSPPPSRRPQCPSSVSRSDGSSPVHFEEPLLYTPPSPPYHSSIDSSEEGEPASKRHKGSDCVELRISMSPFELSFANPRMEFFIHSASGERRVNTPLLSIKGVARKEVSLRGVSLYERPIVRELFLSLPGTTAVTTVELSVEALAPTVSRRYTTPPRGGALITRQVQILQCTATDDAESSIGVVLYLDKLFLMEFEAETCRGTVSDLLAHLQTLLRDLVECVRPLEIAPS